MRDRYDRYLNTLDAISPQNAVLLYARLAPLFEEAYQELGLSDGSFHNTLLLAIDVLQATPDYDSSLELIQPSVMYKFRDSRIENLTECTKAFTALKPNTKSEST